jgi:hypothetical protein
LSGSDCTVLPERTSPTVVVSVCWIGAASVTSTVSARPTPNLKSRRATCLASRGMGAVVEVRNPDSSALMTYVPTVSGVMV